MPKLHITNGIRFASFGGSASVRLGHSASLHSHGSLQHSLPALVLLRKPLYGLANRSFYNRDRYVPYVLNLILGFRKEKIRNAPSAQ